MVIISLIIQGGILIQRNNWHGLKKIFCFGIILLFISSGCMIIPSEKNVEDNIEQNKFFTHEEGCEDEVSTEENKIEKFNECNYQKNEEILHSLMNNPPSAQSSEFAIAKGYILDNESKLAIEDAHVFIFDSNVNFGNVSESVYTDDTGYYELNLNNEFGTIHTRAHGYFSENEYFSNLEPGKTYWINFSLIPGRPSENSTINIELYDNDTNECIQHALIIQQWRDQKKHIDYNYSTLKQDCIYQFQSSKGTVSFFIFATNYFSEITRDYTVNESEDRTFVFYLNHLPPENSMVHGLVRDNVTKNPIENAFIGLTWRNLDYSRYYHNYTSTNSSGEYAINVAAGIVSLSISKEGYFHESTHNIVINESEIKKIDIVLYPLPEETSLVQGMVTDRNTGESIENASVRVYWEDSEGHYYLNTTKTDENGFYEMNVAEGQIHFSVYADNYFNNYSDDYVIGENEILTIDFSLDPIPDENAKIVGVVKDSETNQVLNNATVRLNWEHELGYYDYNQTVTDENGFFMMNVAEGYISLTIQKENYYSAHPDDFFIEAYEVKNMEIFLTPHPKEYSIVYGYVKEYNTNNPIENATVYLHWNDNQGHYSYNNTKTDQTGFYTMNVPAGEIDLDIEKEGYYDEYTDDFTIEEYESIQVNFTLYPQKSETATVNGFIFDSSTEDPVDNARVSISWSDEFDHYTYNYTYANEEGFFAISTAPGTIDVRASKNNYFSEGTDRLQITEFETISLNFSLTPRPEQTSLVKGIIRNIETNEPIVDCSVTLHWQDSFGHYSYNYTNTDEDGYYEMNVAPGEIYFYLSKDGYFSDYTDNFMLSNSQIRTLDFSLYPIPPENANVNGYVKNSETDEPVSNATVSVFWSDPYDNSDNTYTKTDENGFYQVSVAAGIIDVTVSAEKYYSAYSESQKISEYETISIDIMLTPKPEENAEIQGYILDETTKDPIENVYIRSYWNDSDNHYDNNETYTDEQGFYSLHVPEGSVHLSARKEGYISNYTDRFWVNQHEILAKTLTLFKKPEEHVRITGFVYFKDTETPMNNCYVSIYWQDEQGHAFNNDTQTDNNGYYEIFVPAGMIDVEIGKPGFLESYKTDMIVYDNEHLWLNTSLTLEPFDLNLVSPSNGIYFKNNKVLPLLFRSIVIGDIEFIVDASNRATKVEFYVDARLKKTDTSQPFEYYWDEKSFLLHRHLIKIKAYDDYGNSVVERKMMIRYF